MIANSLISKDGSPSRRPIGFLALMAGAGLTPRCVLAGKIAASFLAVDVAKVTDHGASGWRNVDARRFTAPLKGALSFSQVMSTTSPSRRQKQTLAKRALATFGKVGPELYSAKPDIRKSVSHTARKHMLLRRPVSAFIPTIRRQSRDHRITMAVVKIHPSISSCFAASNTGPAACSKCDPALFSKNRQKRSCLPRAQTPPR